MSSTRVDRRLALVTLLAVAALTAMGPTLLQADEAPAAAAQQQDGAQERAQPRGRLPDYYTRVVSVDQREKIYEIQKSYQPQIDELLSQIAKLEAQRAQEIDALLTPEQLERVKQLAQEAEARRAARLKDQAAPTADVGQ